MSDHPGGGKSPSPLPLKLRRFPEDFRNANPEARVRSFYTDPREGKSSYEEVIPLDSGREKLPLSPVSLCVGWEGPRNFSALSFFPFWRIGFQ